jgi:hypothetical protein
MRLNTIYSNQQQEQIQSRVFRGGVSTAGTLPYRASHHPGAITTKKAPDSGGFLAEVWCNPPNIVLERNI